MLFDNTDPRFLSLLYEGWEKELYPQSAKGFPSGLGRVETIDCCLHDG